MKKTTAGLTLTAITGFGLFAATPALAAEPAAPSVSVPGYATCAEARAAGRTNIPAGDPEYTSALDRDKDGFGCDADNDMTMVDPTTPPTPSPSPSETMAPPAGGGGGQVDRMPSGGANTGIAQEPEESNAGVLALGGGLVLAAAAGGTFVVRRRLASQE
ncbi:excalibur calcium-binding domain-containing protein [Arthrobacter zhaoxinii]|uniref:excalibur calcium-binding domain-containing protein n=1 Tax=Arthrobacter zhaoxinii TaxID=2964616 RepID=UPI002104D0A7|nr:excalibur calcium-binding domain-containing protein [Arthrobacter zhaoxinii]MCQ2000337.1 excalibur calcium-binding domain-containing protein [Arthrobacter zhaoxinii]